MGYPAGGPLASFSTERATPGNFSKSCSCIAFLRRSLDTPSLNLNSCMVKVNFPLCGSSLVLPLSTSGLPAPSPTWATIDSTRRLRPFLLNSGRSITDNTSLSICWVVLLVFSIAVPSGYSI